MKVQEKLAMKVQSVDIRAGDQIIAYCNQKKQICKVHSIVEKNVNTISLSISISETSRNALRRIVRFRRDALVELHSRKSS